MTVKVLILKTGNIQEVSEGYARNFLIPKKVAKLATGVDVQQAKIQHQSQVKKQNQQVAEWKRLATLVGSLTVDIVSKTSPSGTLYERLATSDILQALRFQHQVTLDPDWLKFEPIKQVGTHQITVHFPNSMISSFHATVKAK